MGPVVFRFDAEQIGLSGVEADWLRGELLRSGPKGPPSENAVQLALKIQRGGEDPNADNIRAPDDELREALAVLDETVELNETAVRLRFAIRKQLALDRPLAPDE